MPPTPPASKYRYFTYGDPAYSPRVEDITLAYIDPTLVTETDQTILLSSAGPRTNDRRRLLKLKTDNPDLSEVNHELGYLGATGGNLSEFTRFDTTIRDESTSTEYLQFNFPPFPAAPPEVASGSSAPFSITADNTVYLTQSFGVISGPRRSNSTAICFSTEAIP